MAVLVAGGAGYIGSVTVERLLDTGRKVVVYDNLSRGHREAVPKQAVFIEGNIADEKHLKKVLETYEISCVMHFCALSLVGESMKHPLWYWENNIAHGITLLKCMYDCDVPHIIFSSSAAVYGDHDHPVDEGTPLSPTNPYGLTKLAFETLLSECEVAYGTKYVSLRYFNAAGASEEHGEDHPIETHLIPLILKVAMGRENGLTVFGNDYDTKDGTCVRDYIHVVDLADAHILALEYLEKRGKSDIFNLGNGAGFTVLEVIKATEQVTGQKISYTCGSRRPGDPAILVASSEKIMNTLGWCPRYPELETIIESAFQWRRKHPDGYKGILY